MQRQDQTGKSVRGGIGEWWSGAHTETLLWSDRFNVCVTKVLFCFTAQRSSICLLFLSKYTCFERKVDIIQMILWYKNMNIYNHQPQLHTITPPPYKKERKIKAFNKMKRYIFFYTVKNHSYNCG